MTDNPQDEYIDFGDYCRSQIGITCQYGFYLLEGLAGHPVLKEGLRITGNNGCYHSIRIHKDDAPIFKERYENWRKPKEDECEGCDCVVRIGPSKVGIACHHEYLSKRGIMRTIPIQYSSAPPWCPKKALSEKDWTEKFETIWRLH